MKDYQKSALRTESPAEPVVMRVAGDSKYVRLVHASLGIAGEVGELMRAMQLQDRENGLEEIGDLLWYLAVGYGAIGRQGPDAWPPHRVDYASVSGPKARGSTWAAFFNLVQAASTLVDVVKAHTFYDKQLFKDAPLQAVPVGAIVRLEQALDDVTNAVHIIAKLNYGVEVSELMHRNIAKLQKRYPAKFEETLAAGERDYQAEAEAASRAASHLAAHGEQTEAEQNQFCREETKQDAESKATPGS